METELLIIKTENRYVRVKSSEYLICGLDKASVFPMEKLETVREHAAAAAEQLGGAPRIYKLILREEPLK